MCYVVPYNSKRLNVKRKGEQDFMEKPWESYKSEVLEIHCISYTIPEAALIWCRVPKDQIADIIKQSKFLSFGSGKLGEIWEHHKIPCLKDASAEISEAINSGTLPYELHDKPTVVNSKYPFYRRQKILHREFIKWMKDAFPNESTEFIFGDAECNSRSDVSVEDFQSLEKQIVDLNNQIKQLEVDSKSFEEENDAIMNDYLELMEKVEDAGELKKLERTSYLNMIAVLMKFISGTFPNVKNKLPSFQTEAILISKIVSEYYAEGEDQYSGLSEDNLLKRFREARKKFGSQDSIIRRKKR